MKPAMCKPAGFTLIEILVALAVFAALAAIAWGALNQIARTRAALDQQQQRFAQVARAVTDLERDLHQAISRPVRGNFGELLPALAGTGERIELSRLGHANPRAEQRSNIERVRYEVESRALRRGRYEVLDRAAGSRPQWREQADEVNRFRLRYLDAQGAWQEQWPPRESVAELLPRAVEFSIALEDLGELRRVIALPGTIPTRGVGANGTPVQGSLPPVANPLPSPQL